MSGPVAGPEAESPDEPAAGPWSAESAASRSAISRLSAAGENRIVAPLSTSPPPNAPVSALPAADAGGDPGAAGASGVPGAEAAAGRSGVAEGPGVTGPVGGAGDGGAGAQAGSNPPGVGGSSGEASGAPTGGGGARCEPAPPDESPAAFCVYQAGGV